MKEGALTLGWQRAGGWGLGILAVAGGIGLLLGLQFQHHTYQKTFQELLRRGQLLEPLIRSYLLGKDSGGEHSGGPSVASGPGSQSPTAAAGSSAKSARSAAESFQMIQRLTLEMGKASQTRITVLLPDGAVLGESEEKPEVMEPHGNRPEILQALQNQPGTELRYSHTLRQWMFYAAVPVRQQNQVLGVIRLSVPKKSVDTEVFYAWIWIAGSCGVLAVSAIGIVLVWNRRWTRNLEDMCRWAEQLVQGHWSVKVSPTGPRQFHRLAEALHQLGHILQGRHRTLLTQQSELETILASMTEGVLAVDRQRRVLCCNRSAMDLLGAENVEPVGRYLEEITRHPEVHRLVEEVLAQGESILRQMQVPGVPAREVQMHGTVLGDGEDRSMGVLVVLRDVTRLRQLENLRRDFVANVSHELKTPLTSIQGFVEALLDGAWASPAEGQKFLKIIAAQTQRLQNLIEDLLSLSRIEQETEKQQIALEWGPIREVLRSALELCRPKAEEKHILLDFQCPEELSAPRNPALLEQAVVNLLDNAIKYSPEGATVHLEAALEGQEVLIRVRDHGCGIPPEHLDRIFERFYRVDKARSRKLGGTGLGLAIVKHIALAHGGRVAVQSQVEQGSIFSIALPLPLPKTSPNGV